MTSALWNAIAPGVIAALLAAWIILDIRQSRRRAAGRRAAAIAAQVAAQADAELATSRYIQTLEKLAVIAGKTDDLALKLTSIETAVTALRPSRRHPPGQ